MLPRMPVHERRADRGARLAQVLTQKLGQELRAMRRQAGLSQAAVAREIGIDASAVSRIETGTVMATTLEVYAQLFAVVGGRLSVKVYPEGDPLRDGASWPSLNGCAGCSTRRSRCCARCPSRRAISGRGT